LPEELLYLVDLAYEYLTKNGFSVCKTRGTIDFWNYQINNDPVINSLLDEHNDNYYLDDYNVHTCIFYTQKDETFNGGNLYYFIDSENAFFDILGIDQKKYLLPIQYIDETVKRLVPGDSGGPIGIMFDDIKFALIGLVSTVSLPDPSHISKNMMIPTFAQIMPELMTDNVKFNKAHYNTTTNKIEIVPSP
jgi:hypothetical protein